MNARVLSIVAGIVVDLLLAGLLAFAPGAAAKASPKKAHGVTATAAAKEKANIADHAKAPTPAAATALLASLPEVQRRAIQSDLAWIRRYEPEPPANADERLLAAIKAFQKRSGGAETGQLTDQQRARLASAAKEPKDEAGWRLIDDATTGARLGLPGKLVPQASASRTGSRWTSIKGQIQIETFRLREANLHALFEEEKKTAHRRIGWSALDPNSFTIAGEQGLKRFFVRAEASGSEVRGITILYDQATEGTMAPVAFAMLNSYRGFPDPNAPESRRSIEYGTAIVIDKSGDLLAQATLTGGCQAITVAGFGHAARIAEDTANDLALLRLYGARNLVPAALSGGSADGDLSLVGIADPRAASGDAGVTSVSARQSGATIAPVPMLGFAGAVATDAQGRFAGIVDLKPTPGADGSGAGWQAMLVPVAAIRAFLKARGITPAAGSSPIEQSVLRVICVRQ